MIQIGDTWEIGKTVYYVDNNDKTLVKEARIKEVHVLTMVMRFLYRMHLLQKKKHWANLKICDGNLNFSLNISILVT